MDDLVGICLVIIFAAIVISFVLDRYQAREHFVGRTNTLPVTSTRQGLHGTELVASAAPRFLTQARDPEEVANALNAGKNIDLERMEKNSGYRDPEHDLDNYYAQMSSVMQRVSTDPAKPTDPKTKEELTRLTQQDKSDLSVFRRDVCGARGIEYLGHGQALGITDGTMFGNERGVRGKHIIANDVIFIKSYKVDPFDAASSFMDATQRLVSETDKEIKELVGEVGEENPLAHKVAQEEDVVKSGADVVVTESGERPKEEGVEEQYRHRR